MHYHERLEDCTSIGLYDATRDSGEVSERTFWEYHEIVARREHPATRGHIFRRADFEWPLRAIEHARIRTALITTYRVHSAEHLHLGPEFPKTWEARDEKVQAHQRFSPPGRIGYYFGLTVNAAIDEASYYAGTNVEGQPNPSTLILAHRTYFENLLYLAPVLPSVWTRLDLPPLPPWAMYLSVMSHETANEITDAIGEWARHAGFSGIIYPSARYGQNLQDGRAGGAAGQVPLLNLVELGSHLCEEGIAISYTLDALIEGVATQQPFQQASLTFSEPNLVLFDKAMAAGIDRPVFYATYPLHEASVVRARDEREGLNHEIQCVIDEDNVTFLVDDPKYKIRRVAPRGVGA